MAKKKKANSSAASCFTNGQYLAFREQCIWLRICYNTHVELYESGQETLDLLFAVAKHFFHDLNIILIEYIIMQICKITDPATSFYRANLTVEYINTALSDQGRLTEDIKRHTKTIMSYRDIVNTARNRLITHFDRDTVLDGKPLGAHDASDVEEFFNSLQLYNNAVAEALGEQPTDYSNPPGPGDVVDFIAKLRRCT